MAAPVAEFVHDGIRIVGSSLAGEETYFVLPEMNLGFDVGRAPRETVSIDHMFLTHGHMDHAAGIAYYFSQRMFIDNRPGKAYVPAGLEAPLQELLRIWGQIDGHAPEAEIFVARPLEDVALRRDLVVRPFAVNHPSRRRGLPPVLSLGYSAVEVRQKLLEEYTQLDGPALVALKKKGIPITRRVEFPLVTYCGDTGPGDFLDHDFVRRSRVLLLECTFMEAEHRGRARAGGHMHISDIRDALPQLENEKIVLTHLSRRTTPAIAREHLRRELGAAFDPQRISLLLDHRRRRRARPEP